MRAEVRDDEKRSKKGEKNMHRRHIEKKEREKQGWREREMEIKQR